VTEDQIRDVVQAELGRVVVWLFVAVVIGLLVGRACA
jgi:hypothetical protein